MRFFLALAALAVLPACGGGGSASSSGSTPIVQPPPNAVESNTFAALLNGVRVKNGAGVVTYDARLGLAAQRHANDIVANDFFSHTGSDGSTVGSRAKAAGYNWTEIGENIAQGQQSQEAVMTAWTNSDGHHENNIYTGYEDFALAKAGTGGELTWVLVLGAE
jgi:uncharacterized protein YkwD